MGLLIMIFVIITAALLVLVIMLQDEQGEGLGGIFGGGSGSAFGSRSGNILTRITAVMATIFLVLTLVFAFMNKSAIKDEVVETAREEKYKQTSESSWYTGIATDEDVKAESFLDLSSETETEAETTTEETEPAVQ